MMENYRQRKDSGPFLLSVTTDQKCLLSGLWPRLTATPVRAARAGDPIGLPLTLDPGSEAGPWPLPAKGSSCLLPRPPAALTEGRGAASRLLRGLCPGDQPKCVPWGASRECATPAPSLHLRGHPPAHARPQGSRKLTLCDSASRKTKQ